MPTGNSSPKSLAVALFGIALAFAFSTPARAQDVDPQALQQRGYENIQQYLERLRNSFQPAESAALLDIAAKDLQASAAAFLSSGNLSGASVSAFRYADTLRLRNKTAAALAAYTEAASLANQAHNVEFEARARLGQARSENSDSGDSRVAESRAIQALTLAEKDASLLRLKVDILMELGLIEQARGNFFSGYQYLLQAATAKRDDQTPQPDLVQEFQLNLFLSWMENDLFAACRDEHVRMPYFSPNSIAPAHDVERSCSEDLAQLIHSADQTLRVAEQSRYLSFIEQGRSLVEMASKVKTTWDQYLHLREQAVQHYQENRQDLDKWELLHPRSGSDVIRASFFPLLMPAEQRAQYQAGLPAALRTPLPESQQEAYAQATFLDAMGEWDAALKAYLELIRRYESRRAGMTDAGRQGALIGQFSDLYKRVAMMLSSRDRLAEAFELLERRQARVTTDFVASAKPGAMSAEERSSLSHLTLLQAKWDDTRLSRATGNSAKQRSAWAAFSAQFDETNKRFPHLLQAAQIATISLQKLQQIQQAAGPTHGFDFVTYVVYQDRIAILHVGPHTSHVYPVLIFGQALSALLENLNAGKPPTGVDKRASEAASRELFLLLLQPIEGWLETKHIVVVRPPELAGIPLESLEDPADGKYAIEKWSFSYAPSATIAAAMTPTDNLRNDTAFTGADPELVQAGAAGQEVRTVLTLYPGSETVKGDFPTRTQLAASLPKHGFLDLAVHGKFDEAEPMLSEIWLRGEHAGYDPLTAAEMIALPLQKQKLVALSACSSGRVGVSQGTEQFGIVRALLFSGVQSILLTSWDVDSGSAALYMKTFLHEALKHTLPQAAQLASLAVKEKYPDPYYWAAFSLTGR